MEEDTYLPSPAETASYQQYLDDVQPSRLPVLPHTWTTQRGMGIDISAGHYGFLNDGTHIWTSFFEHWGWWKLIALGFYPYTEHRDYYLHEQQGLGRPWLALLEQKYQEMIFRELVLLVNEWNDIALPQYQFKWGRDADEFGPQGLPKWMKRWLSLTNASFRRGIHDIERAAYDASKPSASPEDIERVVLRYRASENTWRPMMPDRAIHHQKYGDRQAYWTFERDDKGRK